MIQHLTAILLLSMISITSLPAMQPATIDVAARVMNKSLDKIYQLRNIDTNEIINVRQCHGPNAQTYRAKLSNGDTLTADYFHTGPIKGEYYCVRSMINVRNDIVMLPVDTKYYSILKNLYEMRPQSNKESVNDNL